jgi:hypothetical protein
VDVTKLTTDNSTNDATSFQTAAVAPGSDTLVLIFVANTRPFVNVDPAIPTVDGNGLSWQQVQTEVTGTVDKLRLTCLRSMAFAPTAGPITIDFGGELQDFCAWSVFEYDGVDTDGIAGDAAVAQSRAVTGNGVTLTASLGPSGDPTRNHSVGGIVLNPFTDPVEPVNPGPGFVEIDEQTPSQFLGKGATLQTQDSPVFINGVQWDWAGAQNAAAIVLEVKAAPLSTLPAPAPGGGPADPVEQLIRRFEPVLFFHPQETDFPVDAKRYVENAALWAAKAAFDDKNGWGGASGDPFPRQPLVQAGQLSAMPSEPGTYLGSSIFLLDDPRNERFLELGGWKDKTGTHESGVTDSSVNVYADRAAIANLYNTDATLKGSTPWYHAELFDTARLTRLAALVSAPDLSKIVSRLTNPMLLCYYLFFPSHAESVDSGACTNIEAKEVGCHAGDWQCIAIMLQGDPSGTLANATPKFFGHTGCRPFPDFVDNNQVFPPHQFDADGLTVMKVAPWRPSTGATANQPEVADDYHPRLYVANGSHSLYMTPGSHEIYPFPQGDTFECAAYETASLLPDDPPNDLEVAGAFFLKMLAAGALNLGPIGVVIGLVAAAAEGVLPKVSGLVLQGHDPADPDEAPAAAGAGKTVQPAGLVLTDGGSDVSDWVSQQGLQLQDRRYDFIVDRATQLWWPGDETPTGFRGRWGQHVTSDFLPRRSGPKFPSYCTMFLLALADGDTRKLIDLSM